LKSTLVSWIHAQTSPRWPSLCLPASLVATVSMMASQNTQASTATVAATKSLTNADVVDLVHTGLSQEIVIAKIRTTACEFDTSPAALKALKAANIPDTVILAMVKASQGPSLPDSVQEGPPSSPHRKRPLYRRTKPMRRNGKSSKPAVTGVQVLASRWKQASRMEKSSASSCDPWSART
jgi:hypothetical protein